MLFRTGPKLNTVFASRWKAVWWGASILLTAYCTIPSKDENVGAELKSLPGMSPQAAADDSDRPDFGSGPAVPSGSGAPHKSPWAKN
jgi:hypothetical protein